MRFCDLELELEGSWMEPLVDRVRTQLRNAGLMRFRPNCYLADEWMSPDAHPAVGLPFYLAHPRLMRLERKMMFEVEGGSAREFMRLLRHEVGHAFQHAYQLHRRRRFQRLFGPSSTPYPESYTPRPSSRRYVVHLEGWYAQAHPDEDFAETFAVWLDPRSAWRKRYAGWPALEKLEYIESLSKELGREAPPVRTRARPYLVNRLRHTLEEHYEERRGMYDMGADVRWDSELRRIFDAGQGARSESAAVFLRRHRAEIRDVVAKWTGDYMIAVDHVLRQMISRARELKLRTVPTQRKKMEFMVMLTTSSMTYVYRGRERRAV